MLALLLLNYTRIRCKAKVNNRPFRIFKPGGSPFSKPKTRAENIQSQKSSIFFWNIQFLAFTLKYKALYKT